MKTIPTFEQFINESSKFFIELAKVSDIDHTRITKWIGQNLKNSADILKEKTGYKIDASNLSSAEVSDLRYFLRSQRYLAESTNEALAADNQVIDVVKELALNIFGEKAILMIDQDMIEISTAATSKSNVMTFTKEVEIALNKTKSEFDIEIDEKEKTVKVYA
jgi:hypothetical protein